MKYSLLYIVPALLLGIFLTSCSELESDISQPQPLSFHKEGIVTPGHGNFHGQLIKENGWSMNECKQCHGTDFGFVRNGTSCLSCHTGSRGPEQCNTCHGSFGDPSRIAPPEALDGSTSTSVRGVGAHAKHIYENTMGNRVSCSNCHVFPQSLYAEGHMDGDNRAEVTLKNIATAFGASNASYDIETGSCSNTYCHGNFTFYKDSAHAEDRFA
ncbi:MAG: hypothetical protein R6W90_00750, partial [Ignavibacteriaceae bacterium]